MGNSLGLMSRTERMDSRAVGRCVLHSLSDLLGYGLLSDWCVSFNLEFAVMPSCGIR